VFLEPIAVDVIAYDMLAAVAAGHEVLDGARILKAQPSWHPPIEAGTRSECNGKT
jgi:hypothetical protein